MAYIKIIVPDNDSCNGCDFLDTEHLYEQCADNEQYRCRIFGNYVNDKKKCVACKMTSMLSVVMRNSNISLTDDADLEHSLISLTNLK